jgi:hypothetical protein
MEGALTMASKISRVKFDHYIERIDKAKGRSDLNNVIQNAECCLNLTSEDLTNIRRLVAFKRTAFFARKK